MGRRHRPYAGPDDFHCHLYRGGHRAGTLAGAGPYRHRSAGGHRHGGQRRRFPRARRGVHRRGDHPAALRLHDRIGPIAAGRLLHSRRKCARRLPGRSPAFAAQHHAGQRRPFRPAGQRHRLPGLYTGAGGLPATGPAQPRAVFNRTGRGQQHRLCRHHHRQSPEHAHRSGGPARFRALFHLVRAAGPAGFTGRLRHYLPGLPERVRSADGRRSPGRILAGLQPLADRQRAGGGGYPHPAVLHQIAAGNHDDRRGRG